MLKYLNHDLEIEGFENWEIWKNCEFFSILPFILMELHDSINKDLKNLLISYCEIRIIDVSKMYNDVQLKKSKYLRLLFLNSYIQLYKLDLRSKMIHWNRIPHILKKIGDLDIWRDDLYETEGKKVISMIYF